MKAGGASPNEEITSGPPESGGKPSAESKTSEATELPIRGNELFVTSGFDARSQCAGSSFEIGVKYADRLCPEHRSEMMLDG